MDVDPKADVAAAGAPNAGAPNPEAGLDGLPNADAPVEGVEDWPNAGADVVADEDDPNADVPKVDEAGFEPKALEPNAEPPEPPDAAVELWAPGL